MRIAIAVLVAVLLLAGAAALLFTGSGPAPRSSGAPAPDPGDVPEAGPAPGGPQPVAPPPGPRAPLEGTVRSAEGFPLSGAVVAARPLGDDGWPGPWENAPTATSGVHGRFAFPGLPEGLYWLEVRDARGWGHLPVVAVRTGGSRPVEIRLLPEASISGSVVDESGLPVAGATVTTDLSGFLRYLHARAGRPSPEEETSFSAETDAAGDFVLERLPIGRYDLRVQAPGHAGRTIHGVVAPVEGVKLLLYAGRVVSVAVTSDRRGDGVIRVRTEPPDASIDLEPDEMGRAEGELAGLPEGRIRIVASAPGCLSAVEEVEIVAGRRSPTVALRLGRGIDVRGRVRMQDGSGGVAGAEVRFRCERSGSSATIRADERGGFATRLDEGMWLLYVRADGCEPYEGVVPVGWGRDGRIEVRLRRAYVIEGAVRYEDGLPVEAARVVVAENSDARSTRSHLVRTVMTDRSGAFRADGLRAGTRYSVRAAGPEGTVPASLDVDLPRGAHTVRADLSLGSEGRGGARGRLIDARGEPVARATVLVPGATTTSDAGGRFAVEGVPSGTRSGWILSAGHPPVPVTIRFPKEGVVDLGRIGLPWEDPQVFGRAVEPGGAGVPFARVRLLDPETGETISDALTRRDGSFAIAWPLAREKTARLVVSSPGRAPEELRGDFGDLSRAPEIRLEHLRSIDDQLENALAGSRIHLLLTDRQSGRQTRHPARSLGERRLEISGFERGSGGIYDAVLEIDNGVELHLGYILVDSRGRTVLPRSR